MHERDGMGYFGGGWLDHPRQCLDARRTRRRYRSIAGALRRGRLTVREHVDLVEERRAAAKQGVAAAAEQRRRAAAAAELLVHLHRHHSAAQQPHNGLSQVAAWQSPCPKRRGGCYRWWAITAEQTKITHGLIHLHRHHSASQPSQWAEPSRTRGRSRATRARGLLPPGLNRWAIKREP